MISIRCLACGDTGIIHRSVQMIDRMIWRDGQRITITDKVGGIDACPECAANARVQWEEALNANTAPAIHD